MNHWICSSENIIPVFIARPIFTSNPSQDSSCYAPSDSRRMQALPPPTDNGICDGEIQVRRANNLFQTSSNCYAHISVHNAGSSLICWISRAAQRLCTFPVNGKSLQLEMVYMYVLRDTRLPAWDGPKAQGNSPSHEKGFGVYRLYASLPYQIPSSWRS